MKDELPPTGPEDDESSVTSPVPTFLDAEAILAAPDRLRYEPIVGTDLSVRSRSAAQEEKLWVDARAADLDDREFAVRAIQRQLDARGKAPADLASWPDERLVEGVRALVRVDAVEGLDPDGVTIEAFRAHERASYERILGPLVRSAERFVAFAMPVVELPDLSVASSILETALRASDVSMVLSRHFQSMIPLIGPSPVEAILAHATRGQIWDALGEAVDLVGTAPARHVLGGTRGVPIESREAATVATGGELTGRASTTRDAGIRIAERLVEALEDNTEAHRQNTRVRRTQIAEERIQTSVLRDIRATLVTIADGNASAFNIAKIMLLIMVLQLALDFVTAVRQEPTGTEPRPAASIIASPPPSPEPTTATPEAPTRTPSDKPQRGRPSNRHR